MHDWGLHVRRRTWARLLRALWKRPSRLEAHRRLPPSSLKIDLITPLIAKDRHVFPLSLHYARENLKHPLGTHYVVGPEHPVLRELCLQHGCTFVNEESVLGFGLERVKALYRGRDFCRAGWIYQQLLKLAAPQISREAACLVLDADTLFVSPTQFESAGKRFLDVTDGFHEGYDYILYRLLGFRQLSHFSYVCHHMLFERDKLEALHRHIEARCGLPWIEAILTNIDPASFIGFSEYELYANFVLHTYPAAYRRAYWFNQSFAWDGREVPFAELLKHAPRLKTASFHSYERPRSEFVVDAQGRTRPRAEVERTPAGRPRISLRSLARRSA